VLQGIEDLKQGLKEEGQEDVEQPGHPKNASQSLVDVNVGDIHIEECFPSDAFVRKENGEKKLMKDVKIGDKILTMDHNGYPKYSEVILMLHQDQAKISNDYVTITTDSGTKLTLSSHHLISAKPLGFVYAKHVRPDHEVRVYNEDQNTFNLAKVVSVELVTKQGLHAPLSMEGTLVVNDVYASCYASFPSQPIAHIGFSLWRILYTYFNSFLEQSAQSSGIHWYPRMLMTICGYSSH